MNGFPKRLANVGTTPAEVVRDLSFFSRAKWTIGNGEPPLWFQKIEKSIVPPNMSMSRAFWLKVIIKECQKVAAKEAVEK